MRRFDLMANFSDDIDVLLMNLLHLEAIEDPKEASEFHRITARWRGVRVRVLANCFFPNALR